ncbi:MAG: hypothetical protein P4L55_07535, partial [Syntrophobacteraceae bacterium]|nr:hypothetical protein [Syntrophobacteraceae bacterium]
MDGKKRWGLALVILAAFMALMPVSRAPAQQGPVLVGRISFIDGQLLRYVPEIKDWVLIRPDSPFGLNDALYSGDSAKAEFIFPNGLLARVDASTQIQLIALKEDASEMDLASGIARFYNKNPNGMLKVTTPFGYVLAQPNSIFDLYVGDQSVQVIDLSGQVDYIQQSDNSSYELSAGGPSIVADLSQVSNGAGDVAAPWDDWNSQRDSLLAQRIEEDKNSDSYKYLPRQLHYDANDLNRSGRWERVLYQGQYRQFWRPTKVSASWQPFTVGRWTDYYGDQVWVPEESFGYVTGHYGNWLHINGGWYWSPPAPGSAAPSGTSIAFGWYPGRVAWIGTGQQVGWIPLAPNEPYYAHHYWGPASVMATGASIAIGGLAYASAAVIVPQRDFYSVSNYSSVRITNINKTVIINNYHAAPVVNNTVFQNYSQTTARYNFINKAPAVKPYVAVDKRIIRNNQAASSAATSLTASTLRQAAATTRHAKPVAKGVVPPPARLTSKLVPASQAKAPENRVKFKTLSIKTPTKPATSSSAARPATPGQAGHPQVMNKKPAKPAEHP